MSFLNFKYQKHRLSFWFLTITIIPLLAAFGFSYFNMRNQIKQQEIEKLLAVRDLKVREINNWLSYIENDLAKLARNSRIRELFEVYVPIAKQETYQKELDYVKYVIDYWTHVNDYAKEVFVADAFDGTILASSNPYFLRKDIASEEYFRNCLVEKRSSIKDIYKEEQNGFPEMLFATPIIDSHTNRVLAVVGIKINLNASLYGLMLNRTGMGETGETLIVNEDVYTLSELRWYKDAPLNLKIEANPAVKSSQGITGIERTKDYRGIEIYAAYTHIEKTGWGFVAKRDVKELSTPINKLSISFLLIMLVTIVVLIVVSRFVAQSIAKPITNMSEMAKEFKEGNFAIRTEVLSNDEIGDLATSVNDMADTIERQDYVQKGRQKIADSLISIISFEELWKVLCSNLMEISNSNTCACYVFDSTDNTYKHEYSIGLNKEMIIDFSANEMEGELGLVVSSQKLIHKTKIDKDGIIRLRTTAYDSAPQEMISFPVLNEHKVYAVLSISKNEPFAPQVVDIIKQASGIIDTALSNILAMTKTQILAEELTQINETLQEQQDVTQKQNDELQRQRDVLNAQAQELKHQNVELEIQRNQVEEATRMKSEFLSNMSHELRTPLNSVMALSRVLLMQTQEKLSDDEINYLEIIERNGKNLLTLINSILDLSKIEAGKTDLSISSFDINKTIKLITENISRPAIDKGLQVVFELDPTLEQLESDENKIIQIVQNIVGNAIKFTEKGFVKIATLRVENAVLLSIQDTGIGISETAITHIFEEFRQADGSTSRKFEGSGLGLSIAQRLVHLLKGTITAKSTEGEGSLFEIRFPLHWTSPTIQNNDREPAGIQEGKRIKKRVLVVDDEPAVSKIIADYLSEAGYETHEFNNGKDLLRGVRKMKPFAITLDLVMPDMDGYEILQALKEDPETAGIPVVVVSVSKDKDTAMALGAVGYISKPIIKDMLIDEIKRISTNSLSVLVVDDNDFERKNVSQFLTEDNYIVYDAADGVACLEVLKETTPDVILLDLVMPRMDGFKVIEKLNEDPITAAIPVIIATAKDLSEQERITLEKKSISVLEKNYSSTDSILRQIERTLEKLSNPMFSPIKKGKTTLLIVEDNESAILQLTKVLEKEGYEIVVARGGQEAIDFVQHTTPDGLILDLMMPGVDGFQVLENIRGREETKLIPVLILTAKNLTKEDLQVLSNNNVQQLIQKGDVDPNELKRKVELMLGVQHHLPEKPVEAKKKDRINTKHSNGAYKKRSNKILVIEDNPDNLATINAILKSKYELVMAKTGTEGIEFAFAENPELILLDMMLPEMNGLEVLAILRDDIRTKDIVVVALTAQAMKGDRERFLEAGCNDYMSKPIDPLSLLELIEKWLYH